MTSFLFDPVNKKVYIQDLGDFDIEGDQLTTKKHRFFNYSKRRR